MKNQLGDLDDHLFAQLNRLSSDDLDGEALDAEIKRAEAIVAVADKVVDNTALKIKAADLFGKYGIAIVDHLPMIGKSE